MIRMEAYLNPALNPNKRLSQQADSGVISVKKKLLGRLLLPRSIGRIAVAGDGGGLGAGAPRSSSRRGSRRGIRIRS